MRHNPKSILSGVTTKIRIQSKDGEGNHIRPAQIWRNADDGHKGGATSETCQQHDHTHKEG